MGQFSIFNARSAGRWTNRTRSRRVSLNILSLEDRLVPSTIVWENRGTAASDSDGFGAVFGDQAAAARRVVDAAIDRWESVIDNFNYQDVGTFGNAPLANTYTIRISAADLDDGLRGVTNVTSIDQDGKPFRGEITLDDEPGGGWFIDPTPGENSEFTDVRGAFRAVMPAGSGTANDLLRTTLHELGHAMGIATAGDLRLNDGGFLTNVGTDQVAATNSQLVRFASGGVAATLIRLGGTHVYDGPADPNFANSAGTSGDLLNPGRNVNNDPTERRLISALDARILRAAYGYDVNLPGVGETFLADLNADDGVLTIRADPTAGVNTITVRQGGLWAEVTVNGVFRQFEIEDITSIQIFGGAGADTITLGRITPDIAVNIDAGGGSDTIRLGDATIGFVPWSGGIVTVNGGGGFNDVLTVNDLTMEHAMTYGLVGSILTRLGDGTVSFGNIDRLVVNGSNFGDSFAVNVAPTIPVEFNGNGGVDRVTGPIAANTFNLTGVNAGFVAGVSFGGVENLSGGNSTDIFRFTNGAAVTGEINGGGGSDTLDFANVSTPVTVNLATTAATNLSRFLNVETVVAGTASDTLIGANVANIWNVTVANGGTVGGITFRNFENLQGGSQADTFRFGNGQGVTGAVDGRGGIDALDYSAYTSPVTMNLQTRVATGLASFLSIEGFTGGSVFDTLVAPDQDNTWEVIGTNSGKVSNIINLSPFPFASVENLVGGMAKDTFTLSDGKGVSGQINGRGGADRINYAAYTTSVVVDLANFSATNVGSVTGVENATGGLGDDFLRGDKEANVLLGGPGGADILLGLAGPSWSAVRAWTPSTVERKTTSSSAA